MLCPPTLSIGSIMALSNTGIPQAARKRLHFRSPGGRVSTGQVTPRKLTFLWQEGRLREPDSSSISADPTDNNLKEAGKHYEVTLWGFGYCFLNCFAGKSHVVPQQQSMAEYFQHTRHTCAWHGLFSASERQDPGFPPLPSQEVKRTEKQRAGPSQAD